jgi:hypothetical protein|tara:strand:+ start:390 stop:578 length:189 start_codon:yes stop_codon:yes gene_type:complete
MTEIISIIDIAHKQKELELETILITNQIRYNLENKKISKLDYLKFLFKNHYQNKSNIIKLYD